MRTWIFASDPAAASPAQLSDHEGSLLTLLLRCQPATAYQLLKVSMQSPFGRLNQSKGSLYPLTRRLIARGLIKADRISGDGRKARLLTCTASGVAAVRIWALRIDDLCALPDDLLFAKASALDRLDATEQRDWVAAARDMMTRRMAELTLGHERFGASIPDIAYAGAMLGLRGRLDWLDLLSRRMNLSGAPLPLSRAG